MYKEVNSKFQFLGCLSFWRLFLGFFHFGVVFKFLVILIVGVVFIFGVVFFFEVVFILGLYSFLKFLSFLGSSSFLGFFHFWIQYTLGWAEKLKMSKIYYRHEVPVVIHKNKGIPLFTF